MKLKLSYVQTKYVPLQNVDTLKEMYFTLYSAFGTHNLNVVVGEIKIWFVFVLRIKVLESDYHQSTEFG